MPNAIKYNVSAETLALKKGNFYIGTGDVGKGPTSNTGFYNGITPPSGGYTIYLNKASGGPSIYTVSTEAQLVSLTNTIGAQSFTTSGQCLNWFATQTDKMVFNIDYPAIVTDGLIFNVDAGFTPSYPTTATTWYDVSSGGNNGTLINGPTYSTSGGGSIVFDGTDDYIRVNGNVLQDSAGTISVWTKVITNANNKFIVDAVGSGINRFYIRQNSPNITLVRGANVAITIPAYTLGVWYNITMTWDSTTFYAYSNETFIGSLGYTGGGSPTTIYIGSADPNNNFYNGDIANTQMYNRALTQTEITQNYNATKSRFGL